MGIGEHGGKKGEYFRLSALISKISGHGGGFRSVPAMRSSDPEVYLLIQRDRAKPLPTATPAVPAYLVSVGFFFDHVGSRPLFGRRE